MRDFSTIDAPLNDLTRKDVSFLWGATWKKYYRETTEERKERWRLNEENIDKKVKENVIVDALSCRYTTLSQLDFKIFGLETIKDQYVHDADFKDLLHNCKDG